MSNELLLDWFVKSLLTKISKDFVQQPKMEKEAILRAQELDLMYSQRWLPNHRPFTCPWGRWGSPHLLRQSYTTNGIIGTTNYASN